MLKSDDSIVKNKLDTVWQAVKLCHQKWYFEGLRWAAPHVEHSRGQSEDVTHQAA